MAGFSVGSSISCGAVWQAAGPLFAGSLRCVVESSLNLESTWLLELVAMHCVSLLEGWFE